MKNKHAEIIKSWADGANIEGRCVQEGVYEWVDIDTPSWNPEWEYRIKNPLREVIDAYSRGKPIQYFDELLNEWCPATTPSWNIGVKYRVHPNPNQEFIDAEAEGKQIQYFEPLTGEWLNKRVGYNFSSRYTHRIMPKPLKYEDPAEEIESVLDCMDFCVIKKTMDFLEWKWWDTDGVPEIWHLRKKARELLKDAAAEVVKRKEKSYFIATGGFVATANVYDDDPKIYLDLKFVLTDWSNWD